MSLSAKSWLESRQTSEKLAGVAKRENAGVRKHGVQAAIFGKKRLRRKKVAGAKILSCWRRTSTGKLFVTTIVDVPFPKDFTFVLRTFYLSVAAMSFKTR